MTPFNLLVILVFSLVARGAFAALAGSAFADHWYMIDLIGQAGLCILFVVLPWRICRLTKSAAAQMFGRFEIREVSAGALLGIVILCFTFGESALTTMFISRLDPTLAYSLGSFHEPIYPADSFLSLNVMSFVLVNVLTVAVAEEFFFRALLVPALMQKRSFIRSVMIASLIFTALHLQKSVFVNTFLFATSLSWMYHLTRSLYPCIAAHISFNFLAFLSQHYFDFHRVRSINQLSHYSDWAPELALLTLSLAAGMYMWARTRNYSNPLTSLAKRMTAEEKPALAE